MKILTKDNFNGRQVLLDDRGNVIIKIGRKLQFLQQMKYKKTTEVIDPSFLLSYDTNNGITRTPKYLLEIRKFMSDFKFIYCKKNRFRVLMGDDNLTRFTLYTFERDGTKLKKYYLL